MLDRNFLDRWNSVLMDLEGADVGFYLNTFMELDELGVSEDMQDRIAEFILLVLEKSSLPFPLVSFERSNNEGSLAYIAINGSSITEDVLVENSDCDVIASLEDEDQAREFFTQLVGVVSAMWASMKEVEAAALKYFLKK